MAFYRSGGGENGALKIPLLSVGVGTANATADTTLNFTDVTQYKTLKLGKVAKTGSGNLSNAKYIIRDQITSGTTYATYNYTLSNSEQTFDITNFTELQVIVQFKSSASWTYVEITDFVLE